MFKGTACPAALRMGNRDSAPAGCEAGPRAATEAAPCGHRWAPSSSRATWSGVWHVVMVTAVASGAPLAMGPGARQGGGVSEGSGLVEMHKDHAAPQQEPLPPGHGAQSPLPEHFHSWGTPSSCGSTEGSLARSWGAVGSRHSPPIANPKGRLCPDPPGCRSPSPCPACGAAGEPKVVGGAPCPAAAGLRRTAPANGESRLLLPAGHAARGPHRPPLGSALTSHGCPCACVALLAVPSPAALGCPGQDPWRGQVMGGARAQPEQGFAQAGGTGRAARPHSAGKDLAPLGSLLTAAFRGFALRAPLPGPRPSFPSGSCPYRSLNSITLTPPPALGLQPAPDLPQPCSGPMQADLGCQLRCWGLSSAFGSRCPAPQGAPEPPLPPGARPPSPSCRSHAPTGHHSPLAGGQSAAPWRQPAPQSTKWVWFSLFLGRLWVFLWAQSSGRPCPFLLSTRQLPEHRLGKNPFPTGLSSHQLSAPTPRTKG